MKSVPCCRVDLPTDAHKHFLFSVSNNLRKIRVCHCFNYVRLSYPRTIWPDLSNTTCDEAYTLLLNRSKQVMLYSCSRYLLCKSAQSTRPSVTTVSNMLGRNVSIEGHKSSV